MSSVKVVKNIGKETQKKNTSCKKKLNPYLVHAIATVFNLYTQKILFNRNAFSLRLNAKVCDFL